MSGLDVVRASNAWLMTVLGLGLGPDTAAVTMLVWALIGCGCAASVCVARRAKADWKARQLRDDEPLIVCEPVNAKVPPKVLTAGLLPSMVRFPLWMVPYAQLLALGAFDKRMQWTAPVDGAGSLPTAAKLCRGLLLAEQTGTWGPVERGEGWRGSSPIAPWLEAGDETLDERIFWLTALGFPLLLVWASRQALGHSHTTCLANVCVDFIGACSLPAWRILFMPIGGVCPENEAVIPDQYIDGSGTGPVGRPVFSATESINAPRCWQRDGMQNLLMATTGAALLLPCWVMGMMFASHAETLWHGAGQSVYVNSATAEKRGDEESATAPTRSLDQNNDDNAKEDEENMDVSAHPLDRFPCRVHYAIYRIHRLSLATAVAVALQGAGVGPPIVVVTLTLTVELWCLWRKPFQHRSLNNVKAFIVFQALIVSATALVDVTVSGNIDPAGVEPQLLQQHKRMVPINFVSVSSLLMWSTVGIALGVHLVRDYRRRWRVYRQMRTIANATKALSVIKSLVVPRMATAVGRGAEADADFSSISTRSSTRRQHSIAPESGMPLAHKAKSGRNRSKFDVSSTFTSQERSDATCSQQPRPPSRGVANPRKSQKSSSNRRKRSKAASCGLVTEADLESGVDELSNDMTTHAARVRSHSRSRKWSPSAPPTGPPPARYAFGGTST